MTRAASKTSKAKPATKRAPTAKSALKTKPKAVAKAPAKSTAAAKVPKAAPAAEPTVVNAPQAVIMGPVLRKKELVETVVARSGRKKKDVKPVVESLLAVMGEALGDNRELNLPPFGRVVIRKEKKLARGRVVMTKIRQSTPPAAAPGADPEGAEKD